MNLLSVIGRRRAALACACLALLACLSGNAHAALTWEFKDIHLTATPYDKEVTARFPYTNTTDAPVKIKSIRSSCGCVVPTIRDLVVAPGEKGEITAVFALEHRLGDQKRPIAVEYDDPARTRIGLYLHVRIPEVIRPQAKFVRWAAGEALEPKTLTVDADEAFPIKELLAKSKNPKLSFKVTPGKDGRQFQVEVQPTADKAPIATVLTLEAIMEGDRRKRRDVYVWVGQ